MVNENFFNNGYAKILIDTLIIEQIKNEYYYTSFNSKDYLDAKREVISRLKQIIREEY